MINRLTSRLVLVLIALPSLCYGHLEDGPLVTATHIQTHHDNVPRFCGNPTVTAVQSGLWSSPATWSNGTVPGANARVRIPHEITVTYDRLSDLELYCIEVDEHGTLQWKPDISTRLRVVHFQVLPGGTLTIGTEAAPIAVNATAEIVFVDRPLEVNGQDPLQYGNGLHIYGTLNVHGRSLGQTFARFNEEAKANNTTLKLTEAPVGWRPGDRLLIPDTRQIKFVKNHIHTSNTEDSLQIASVNGTQVQLQSPVQSDHLGPRDALGNLGPIEKSMFPHVGNLTRNIVIRSETFQESGKSRYCLNAENLTDTAQCITRGYVILFMRADIDIRYARFLELGRTTNIDLNNTQLNDEGEATSIGTNQIGRYSIHLHHLIGPVNHTNTGYQFKLVGNVVDGFLKWGIAIHGAHYGLISNNIVYDGHPQFAGSAIATEDGNESYNVFERNFVVHLGAGDQKGVMLGGGRGGVFNGRALFGVAADGLWFSGQKNYVRDNVVSGTDFGYNYNGYYLPSSQRIPNFRGANTLVAGEYTQEVAPGILESARNEAYGATGQGLWMGWSRGCCNVQLYQEEVFLSNYLIWNVQHSGVETYHESKNTFNGFILRNDANVSRQSQGGSARFTRGWNLGNISYEVGNTIIRNTDVQGFNVGVRMPPNPVGLSDIKIFTIEDSYFKNHANLLNPLPEQSNTTHLIRNVVLETAYIPTLPHQDTTFDLTTPHNLEMRAAFSNINIRNGDSRTLLVNLGGVAANDFEVFFEEQAPNFIVPADDPSKNFIGCPEAGLTNVQCLAQYGVAVAGHIAPCIQVDNDPTCELARARAASFAIKGLLFSLTDNEPAHATILSPPSGGPSIVGTQISVAYSTSGNVSNTDKVSLQIDNQPIVSGLNTGTQNYIIQNVPFGTHNIRVWLTNQAGVEIPNSSYTVVVTNIAGTNAAPNAPTNLRLGN